MKKLLALTKYTLLGIGLLTLILMFVMDVNQGVDIMLIWAYILLGIAIVVSLLLPLINLASNPKGAMRSLIGLAIVVVVVGVSYAMSSTEPVVNTGGGMFDNPFDLKLTDTGLYTTYAAFLAAIVLVVLGEIRNSFK